MDDSLRLTDGSKLLEKENAGQSDVDDTDDILEHELQTDIPYGSHNDRDITEISSSSKEKKDVKLLIQMDVISCDALLCLFVAAAKSYRFSSILRPFPPMYQDRDEKNMFGLVNVS